MKMNGVAATTSGTVATVLVSASEFMRCSPVLLVTMICEFVPRILACKSSLKPVMIPSVAIKAATPIVTPAIEINVLKEMVRLRRFARR